MCAKLAWVGWTAHRDAEPVVKVEILEHQVDALEATEHVADRQQTRPVLVQFRLNVQVFAPILFLHDT
eukprot:CAMPEP_0170451562 /NCGR_PEP_ID=MMETSP0123-20130129/761_1 /TAXON_ID=182087 /ORGANISM="Favella ehrenbergii, Strain Fehren 1" /LENGTH=67 /DNA_ID=CAMNT_0010713293 /DNA_START=546 /DNA_END=749 /DNA_ORIENTATION=-